MLFERTPDLVVLASRDGRIVSMNPAVRAFLDGRTAAGTHLHALLDVVSPALSAKRRAALDEALRSAHDWQGTVDLLDAVGNLVPYACTLASDDEGLLLLARDTHELRAREAVERELAG